MRGLDEGATYVWVKLSFVNANDVPLLPLIADLSELADCNSLLLYPKQLVKR
jgi:hypothetical protein